MCSIGLWYRQGYTQPRPALPHIRHLTFLTPFRPNQGQVAPQPPSYFLRSESTRAERGRGLSGCYLHQVLQLLSKHKDRCESWGGENQRNRREKSNVSVHFLPLRTKWKVLLLLRPLRPSQTWNLLIVIFGIPHSLAAGTVLQRQLYNVSRFK